MAIHASHFPIPPCRKLRSWKPSTKEYGIHISDTKVGELLEPMGYSRQNNQKMLQAGKESPDRDKQQDGRRVSESRKSCPFRRYEEEGKPGQFQERRNRILSERKTETGARP